MNKHYRLMTPGDPFPLLGLQIAIDLETTGLSLADPDVQVCGIGIGDEHGQYYFPLRHQVCPELPALSPQNFQGTAREDLERWLNEILHVSERRVIFHNAAFDLGFLRKELCWPNWNILTSTIEDSMILATLLDENRSVSLEQLTRSLLKIAPEQKEKFQGFFAFYTLSPEIVSDYCCEDVWLTLNVWKKLTQHPDYQSLEQVYRHEVQFSFTLAQMELQGCCYSKTELDCIRSRFFLEWPPLLEQVFSLLPTVIKRSEFLRSPGGITNECLRLWQKLPYEEQPEAYSTLIKLKSIVESYERLDKMLAIFPRSNNGVVSPRYYVVKTDGRLVSPLQELEKNALSHTFELKKLIAVAPLEYLCEICFEPVFPNPLFSGNYVISLLGRRKQLNQEADALNFSAFLAMATSEFMKAILILFAERVLFYTDQRILIKVTTPKEIEEWICRLPNPLKVGETWIPFQTRKSFGKNWQEMSSETA